METIVLAIAALAATTAVLLGIAIFALMRWMAFESRIDRRRKRRERFQASWGAMLRDAELAAQNLHRGSIDRS
jgi:hypothetical protein